MGAVLFGMYGLITGDVPFESGRNPGSGSRGGVTDTELEEEIEDELEKQVALEQEIEEELRRQEELLEEISRQEEIDAAVREVESARIEAEGTDDPLDAPRPPYVRHIPDSIYDTEQRQEEGGERIVKTLDADRDGRPEIEVRSVEPNVMGTNPLNPTTVMHWTFRPGT